MATLQRLYRFVLKRLFAGLLIEELRLDQFSVSLYDRTVTVTDMVFDPLALGQRLGVRISSASISRMTFDSSWVFAFVGVRIVLTETETETCNATNTTNETKQIKRNSTASEQGHCQSDPTTVVAELEDIADWVDGLVRKFRYSVKDFSVAIGDYQLAAETLDVWSEDEDRIFKIKKWAVHMNLGSACSLAFADETTIRLDKCLSPHVSLSRVFVDMTLSRPPIPNIDKGTEDNEGSEVTDVEWCISAFAVEVKASFGKVDLQLGEIRGSTNELWMQPGAACLRFGRATEIEVQSIMPCHVNWAEGLVVRDLIIEALGFKSQVGTLRLDNGSVRIDGDTTITLDSRKIAGFVDVQIGNNQDELEISVKAVWSDMSPPDLLLILSHIPKFDERDEETNWTLRISHVKVTSSNLRLRLSDLRINNADVMTVAWANAQADIGSKPVMRTASDGASSVVFDDNGIIANVFGIRTCPLQCMKEFRRWATALFPANDSTVTPRNDDRFSINLTNCDCGYQMPGGYVFIGVDHAFLRGDLSRKFVLRTDGARVSASRTFENVFEVLRCANIAMDLTFGPSIATMKCHVHETIKVALFADTLALLLGSVSGECTLGRAYSESDEKAPGDTQPIETGQQYRCSAEPTEEVYERPSESSADFVEVPLYEQESDDDVETEMYYDFESVRIIPNYMNESRIATVSVLPRQKPTNDPDYCANLDIGCAVVRIFSGLGLKSSHAGACVLEIQLRGLLCNLHTGSTKYELRVRRIMAIDHTDKTTRRLLEPWVSNASVETQDQLSIRLQQGHLRLSVRPIKANIDQSLVEALVHIKNHTVSYGLPESQESASLPIRSVDVSSLKLRIDYKPRFLPNGPIATRVLSLIPLDNLRITLCHVHLDNGPWTSADLITHIGNSWSQDIVNRQLTRCLAGIKHSPVTSLQNLGSGVRDLVIIPIQQYKKDGRVVLGVKRGTTSLLRHVAVESLGTMNAVAKGAKSVFKRVRRLVSPKNETRTRPVPTSASSGFNQAIGSVSHGLTGVVECLVLVPQEAYSKQGTGAAFVSLVKAVPAALLSPVIGVTEGVSDIALGLKNSL